MLFDYPAATVPVREITEGDLEVGVDSLGDVKVLGSWDERCRELWDEKRMDRRVYLGGMLSVQVITGRLEDERLMGVIELVERAIREAQQGGRSGNGETKERGRDSKL